MQETIDVTIKRTIRKMNTLKAQFNEHKDKWQSVSTETIVSLSVLVAFEISKSHD